jgi:predicted MFS family arabinose efflux permease
MVIALFAHASMYMMMAQANSYLAFAGLMALSGIANPLYRVGADAMLADLVDPKKCVEAFALVRWSNNLGVAMGPAIGGYLVVISYTLTFRFAAGGMLLYGLLLFLFARETLPALQDTTTENNLATVDSGYKRVFQDEYYLATVGVIAIVWITATLMWIILPVYSSQQYNIPENQYGFIPSTNALIVVLFQLSMTKFTKHFNPMRMMALGMVFYGICTGLVALSSGFGGFWLSMVIITIGELIFAPTSSTYITNIAPTDMRGRYMSIFNLVHRFASGTGPVLGGWLSDAIHPRATWVGGLVAGLSSALGLMILSRRNTKNQKT